MDLTEPNPLSRGEVQMIDTLGHSQPMTLAAMGLADRQEQRTRRRFA